MCKPGFLRYLSFMKESMLAIQAEHDVRVQCLLRVAEALVIVGPPLAQEAQERLDGIVFGAREEPAVKFLERGMFAAGALVADGPPPGCLGPQTGSSRRRRRVRPSSPGA